MIQFRCRTLPLMGALAVASAMDLSAPPASAQLPFTNSIIDAALTGDCKAIGDLDGDGLPDVVLGGAMGLYWYRAPSWTRTFIAAPQVEFSTDMQLADIDGDGDLDIVIPDGPTGRLGWFENPRPLGSPASTPWTFHPIGEAGEWIHDVQVARLDASGRIDVLTGHHSGYDAWIQTGADTWTHVPISDRQGTGLATGDLDGDGRPDVVLGGVWLKTPADPVHGTWTERTIDDNWPSETAPAVADLNGDGRPDVILVASESAGRLSWYQAPADPLTQPWVEHPIDPSVDYVHKLWPVDIDNDGRLDIVFAEQQQSARARVGYFRGSPGGGGAQWTLTVIATTGSHNIQVGDLGADGDLDIVGSNWQGPPLEAWVSRHRDCTGTPAVSGPSPQTTAPGQSITISVTATGTGPFTYEWRRNQLPVADGTRIHGTTTATLTIDAVQTSDAGSYSAVVTGACGTTQSSVAALDVLQPGCNLAISSHPTNTTASAGESATFTIAASGSPLPRFQWRRNGADIAGATSTTLTIDPVTAADAASYVCVATNSCGTRTSHPALLTIENPFGTASGRPIFAAGDSQGRVTAAYVSTTGHPIVLLKSSDTSAWTFSALDSGEPGSPPSSAIQTWVDPRDGHTYVAILIPSATLVYDTEAPTAGNLNLAARVEEEGVTAIARGLTVFTSTDGLVHLSGLDDNGDLVMFFRTGQPAPNDWGFANLSRDHLRPQGMETPQFVGGLVSFVTSWNALNIAGLGADGEIRAVWWAPGMTLWRTDNLSQIAHAPPLAGSLTAYVTPWGGINLGGVDENGDLVVTWWVPQFGPTWKTTDLTTQFSGPRLRQGSVTSYVTPWGGLNVAAAATDGSVQIYWWVPGMRTWVVTPLSQGTGDDSPLPEAGLTALAAPTGTLNLFGVNADGSVFRYHWRPGSSWTFEDVSSSATNP